MSEQWKPVRDFEGLYEVSNLGRLRSLPREKRGRSDAVYFTKARILEPCLHSGYKATLLFRPGGARRHALVHRLVAEAFVPNPEALPQVNHINSRRTDNQASNLEWTDNKGNSDHARAAGRLVVTRGEAYAHAKLTGENVLNIRLLSGRGATNKEIAAMYRVTASLISLIVNRKRWAHV
jgi:hypothetical protein